MPPEPDNKLAPQSKILKADLTGYSNTETYGANASSNFSMLMGLRFGNKEKSGYKNNPILRLGFTYMNNGSLASGYYQSTSKRYDTLYSYQTGTETYVDSISNRNYNVSYSSEQIRLDLSLIYRTDGKARWSFYSGIGANFGVSLNAYTNISYSNYTAIESDNQYYYPTSSASYYPFSYNFYGNPYPTDGTTQTETFKNKNNTAFSAYIPLAVDFRLGKKRTFWKRTHLFVEFRPGINSVSIPEIGTYTSAFFQTNFGFKINWENL